jgi:hypothetical protein
MTLHNASELLMSAKCEADHLISEGDNQGASQSVSNARWGRDVPQRSLNETDTMAALLRDYFKRVQQWATIKIDRPQSTPDDIKKFEAAMRTSADSPAGDDLSVLQKIDMRLCGISHRLVVGAGILVAATVTWPPSARAQWAWTAFNNQRNIQW